MLNNIFLFLTYKITQSLIERCGFFRFIDGTAFSVDEICVFLYLYQAVTRRGGNEAIC